MECHALLAVKPLRRRLAEAWRARSQIHTTGDDLTRIEAEALSSTDADAIRSFADALDRRRRKADVGRGPGSQRD